MLLDVIVSSLKRLGICLLCCLLLIWLFASVAVDWFVWFAFVDMLFGVGFSCGTCLFVLNVSELDCFRCKFVCCLGWFLIWLVLDTVLGFCLRLCLLVMGWIVDFSWVPCCWIDWTLLVWIVVIMSLGVLCDFVCVVLVGIVYLGFWDYWLDFICLCVLIRSVV